MIYIGSARHDENGKYSGGKLGDNLQKSDTNDTSGEVSMQPFYVHSKGWYILRPKSVEIANVLASIMKKYCNDKNIGYDQGNRLGIISYKGNILTECDCSSLVRRCVLDVTGKDPGNFTTADEVSKLSNTGIFETKIAYVNQTKTPIYDGDVLVTKTKGHTAIVVSGNPRKSITTSTNVPKVAKYTLKKGSKGSEVVNLQKDLNYLGFNLVVDGDFGKNTQTALKNWQRNNGLVDDGIYGPKSYNKMVGLLN